MLSKVHGGGVLTPKTLHGYATVPKYTNYLFHLSQVSSIMVSTYFTHRVIYYSMILLGRSPKMIVGSEGGKNLVIFINYKYYK
jgi:hypothetical protein